MLQKQLLHGRAMIEQFFQDPEHLVPILEVGREPVNVYQDIDQRDVRQDMQLSFIESPIKIFDLREQFLRLSTDLKIELAEYDLIELLENAVLSDSGVLLVLGLDNLVHAVQVLLQPDFVDNQVGIALLIQLLVLPRHVHVLYFVVQQETRRSLLETYHVFSKSFAVHSVEIGAEVLARVGDIKNWPVAKEFEVHALIQPVCSVCLVAVVISTYLANYLFDKVLFAPCFVDNSLELML